MENRWKALTLSPRNLISWMKANFMNNWHKSLTNVYRTDITSNWPCAYHSLLEAPLDFEALALSLHSLLVNLALFAGQLRTSGWFSRTQDHWQWQQMAVGRSLNLCWFKRQARAQHKQSTDASTPFQPVTKPRAAISSSHSSPPACNHYYYYYCEGGMALYDCEVF